LPYDKDFVEKVSGHLQTLQGDDKKKPVPPKEEPKEIPKPDYDDPNSRLKYAEEFSKKYGPEMHGRGDTPLRVNETPDSGSASAKEMSTKAASKYGLDPATFYSSSMEEGMSGLFGDKKGKVDFSGDDKHPISGYVSFGLDNFNDLYPELVKKGYLDKDFAGKFKKSVEPSRKGDNKTAVNSANFVDTDSALQAKAATVKYAQDQTEEFANKNNIELSPKAKQFFSLVNYNSGQGNMQKMLSEYHKKGYLKDDKFLEKRPDENWKQPYSNVARRLAMADALKKEKLF
jgi:hypothetical protein